MLHRAVRIAVCNLHLQFADDYLQCPAIVLQLVTVRDCICNLQRPGYCKGHASCLVLLCLD